MATEPLILNNYALEHVISPTGISEQTAGFTNGYIQGRKPHTAAGLYDLAYYLGERQEQGIQFPLDGSFLNPESQYQFKFQDLLKWVGSHIQTGIMLDAGSGPGHLAYWAKKTGSPIQVIGCDFSSSLLRSQYNQNRSASIVSNVFELPFQSRKFQAILFSDVLEHVWPHQAMQALEEAHRLLDEEGYVFINIPNRVTWNNAAQKDEGHVWLPNLKEINDLLNRSGFNGRKIEIFTRGFPLSRVYHKIIKHDLRLPIFGRSIFACAQK